MKQILFSINFQKKSQKTLVEIGKVHIGVFLKSPILGTKKEILKLILSDCKIEGKIYVFQQISRSINLSKRLKLINGARYYARIGLKSMGILSDTIRVGKWAKTASGGYSRPDT